MKKKTNGNARAKAQPESIPSPPAQAKQIKPMEGLPSRDLLRIGEVAYYFQVTEMTIRNWIDNGHLTKEKSATGLVWITRASVINFRLLNRS